MVYRGFQYISYLLSRLFIALFAFIPFPIVYVLSDISFILFYHLVPYRKKVVFTNLRNSFPSKPEKELKAIAKRFYRFLIDLLFETLKGVTLTEKELLKRLKLVNPELLKSFFEKGQSVIAVTGHYGNWEWGALSGAIQLNYPIIGLYKEISNPFINSFVKKKRAKFQCFLVPLQETYKAFLKYQEQVVLFAMVADQSPMKLRKSYWGNFLNQDTAFIHGPELYANKFKLPVVYFDIQRKRRGFYEVCFSVLEEHPESLPEGELTRRYMKKLEEVINAEPAYWLWSHRRWKRKRSDIH